MIIEGEKWACEACVRGHRVSNCQHADRPLQHINKKGRPVSQCQHCRSMRKSRSAHVKCDCGEKTSKCAHLKAPVVGHRETCCCNHGGRCTCAHKKEENQLHPVPESDSDKETTSSTSTRSATKSTPRNRRRANTIQSDGALTFDASGRHKPSPKHVKAARGCGPYQLSRVHSVHSTNNLSNGVENNKGPSSKSVTTSPQISASCSSFPTLAQGLPPLDLSGIEYPAYVPNLDLFSNSLSDETPMFSAGLQSTSSVDWNNYDGLPGINGSSYGQGSTFGGFEIGSEPAALTNASTNSGDVSEAEDFAGSTGNADDGFRLSTHSSYVGLSQAQAKILANPGSSVPYEDFVKSSNKFLPHHPSLDDFPAPGFSLAEEALWASNYEGVAAVPDSPVHGSPGQAFWERQ